MQRGAAKLERDVSELPVLLHAEVPDDVGMLVGLSEEIDFAVGDAEAGSEDALHGHVAVVETAPGKKKEGVFITAYFPNRVAPDWDL